ncbi:hypothetical protein CYMTET_34338 [Cymbomonas tetramitiformis]|uniref:HAT C-terminal dimerisation domain-containing protein n=1 Tax=Cymbomonas tetramitiformis TaxID=36881 RepID=A0AAE0KQ19_9CHLO|nr:hypothetical protein CYMTET_34338 [Cymbomonas tetramitiformis]
MPALVPAQKKSKGHDGRPIVTAAAFLADSDDEEDATAHIQAGVVMEKEDGLQAYLRIPRVAADVDLLAWWKVQSGKLPHLAKMASQFLAPPASTSGVERAFSAVGHMHGDLRKCTGESTIEHSLMAGMNT